MDVSFKTQVLGARVLVLVECKCYNHAVGVDDVEEFFSKLDDIGAHKGIMVTRVGYQDGAIKTARGRGIALALLTEDQEPGELSYVTKWYSPIVLNQEKKPVLQGNLRPWGRFSRPEYEKGFRFDGVQSLLQMLALSMFDQFAPEANRES
ncbi:hypothetical protein ES703_69637 [subsurface metagenome]